MEMGEKKHEVFLKNLAICWELNRLVNTVLIFHSVNCHSTVHKGGDFLKWVYKTFRRVPRSYTSDNNTESSFYWQPAWWPLKLLALNSLFWNINQNPCLVQIPSKKPLSAYLALLCIAFHLRVLWKALGKPRSGWMPDSSLLHLPYCFSRLCIIFSYCARATKITPGSL